MQRLEAEKKERLEEEKRQKEEEEKRIQEEKSKYFQENQLKSGTCLVTKVFVNGKICIVQNCYFCVIQPFKIRLSEYVPFKFIKNLKRSLYILFTKISFFT